MIIVLDPTALTLLDPSVSIGEWNIFCVVKYPQAIHYIDLNSLNSVEWYWVLSRIPNSRDICTEYGGWSKFNGDQWFHLLKRCPEFEDLCTKYDGWKKIKKSGWRTRQ